MREARQPEEIKSIGSGRTFSLAPLRQSALAVVLKNLQGHQSSSSHHPRTGADLDVRAIRPERVGPRQCQVLPTMCNNVSAGQAVLRNVPSTSRRSGKRTRASQRKRERTRDERTATCPDSSISLIYSATFILMPTRIVAANLHVPPTIESAADVAQRVGCDPQWIVQQTGVLRRHVADDDCDPAEMAAEAARSLVAKAKPDWILHASATRRQSIPDTSVFVQRELGLRGVPAISVQATCLSFLAALQMADGLMSAGRAKSVLITSAELPCRVRNYAEAESSALLGDGAAAVLLDWSPEPSCVEYFAMETWSEGAEYAEIRGGGHRFLPYAANTTAEDNLFHMDGDLLLRHGVPRMKRFVQRIWDELNMGPADIDLVIPHQPSATSLRVLERLGFPPERVVNVLAEYGNCVAASMPMALATALAEKRLQRGDRILLLGTAAGVSLGAAVLRW